MIGFFVGVASGVVQYLLLQKFTGFVSKGKLNGKAIMFAIVQFLFPFAVLVACAFLLGESLMWVGIGMAASLIICAVVRFVITAKNKKQD